jgi:beta-lactamase regulating signal transducer with metallopeptidase domain
MSPLLLELAVKSSLLIAAAGAIDLLMRQRGSAASRHLVWTLAIGGLLILPVGLLAIPRWELHLPIASSVEPVPHHVALATAASPRNQSSPSESIIERPARSGHDGLRTSGSRSFASVSPALIVWGIYAAGVSLLLFRLVLQRRAARRLVTAATALHGSDWAGLLSECVERLDMRGTVRLLRSCEQTVPMTYGTRTPTILVPATADTWNDDRRRAVLLHELAHIVRRDCATQMAAAVACAVYWFHPGVWWAASRMRREREIACDDRVVAAGAQPTDYAGHLLELAYTCIGSRTPALAVSMARPSEIEGRLRSLLDAARNRSTPALRTRMWSAVAAVAVIGLCAAVRATLVPVQAQSAPAAANLLASSQQQARPSEPGRVDAGARAMADGGSGTWQMWVSDQGIARVQLSDRAGSWHGFDTSIANVNAQFKTSSDSGVRTMTLARDAGTFTFEGVLKTGPGSSTVGAGTFTYTPSATFPAELTKRGFTRPTALEQYLLARSDVGFAFIDELATQGYTRPDLATLVRASEHGVTLSHLREMGRLGYRLRQVDALIAQVDHGVTPDFVRELRDLGFKDLTADDLMRTRDHGVDAGYIKELRDLGYNVSSIADAIRTRDHGVDVEYVRALRQFGYRMPLEETIRARDHGIDIDYIRDLSGLGYSNLPMEQLIRTRDHGVDSDYIRQLRQLGYQTSLDALINARDHGVDPEYIRGLAAAGYKGLSLEQLIRLRDHGVDAEFVERIKKTGVTSATPEDLVRIRDRGPLTDRLVDTFLTELDRLRRFSR